MPKVAATEQIDVMFRAFSDRTRLRILNMLRGGETCVCDLVDVLGAPQPKVSRHLAYLRRAGLVVSRKDGMWMHYRLATAKTTFHKSLLNCLACCFQSVPELAKDAERLGHSKSSSTCGTNCC
jgi:ArsR family transcriptional regulator